MYKLPLQLFATNDTQYETGAYGEGVYNGSAAKTNSTTTPTTSSGSGSGTTKSGIPPNPPAFSTHTTQPTTKTAPKSIGGADLIIIIIGLVIALTAITWLILILIKRRKRDKNPPESPPGTTITPDPIS